MPTGHVFASEVEIHTAPATKDNSGTAADATNRRAERGGGGVEGRLQFGHIERVERNSIAHPRGSL